MSANVMRWFVIVIAALMPVACDAVSGAEPTPTPTPWEVTSLYSYLEDENKNNVARLRDMEDKWQVRFRGTVGWLQEKKIRFYVEPPKPLATDKYIECNFRSNADMVALNRGDDVTVRGKLVRAFRGRLFGFGEYGAVVFEDCQLIEIHSSS